MPPHFKRAPVAPTGPGYVAPTPGGPVRASRSAVAPSARSALVAGWCVALLLAVGIRLWNALGGPLLWGYDAWGHVAYVLFLDTYRGLPWADQGWSYFHPPLHYALAWPLAWLGDAQVLARGLSLLASLGSLGTAGLAAWLVRRISPEGPVLSLVAFGAVALLPVQLHLSRMSGNELTCCFFTAAALVSFASSEVRARPALLADARTGILLGLALLAKFSGLLPLLAVLGALAARAGERGSLARASLRALVLVAATLAICGSYYARNVQAFGTPFQKSNSFPLVAEVENRMPPGVRSLRDYVSFPSALFANPSPLAPHLIRSVWGSAYASLWADTYREYDYERSEREVRRERRPMALMVLLGLLPTAVVLLGTALAARDVLRGARRGVYVPLLLLAGGTLVAFALHSFGTPHWAAARASYLMPAALAFGVFCARGVEALLRRANGWQRGALLAGLGGVALVGAVIETEGAVLARRSDAPGAGALYFAFGDYEGARNVYARLAAGAPDPLPWLESLAAVHLADGEPARARKLYARALALGRDAGLARAERRGRLAVAVALAGELDDARSLFDEALQEATAPELLANRGALRLAQGDRAGAESDLRAALRANPELPHAWSNLAQLFDETGRSREARRADEHARDAACRPPRGYPYGLGTGEIMEWGVGRRALLLTESGVLRIARRPFYREACRRLERTAGPREGP